MSSSHTIATQNIVVSYSRLLFTFLQMGHIVNIMSLTYVCMLQFVDTYCNMSNININTVSNIFGDSASLCLRKESKTSLGDGILFVDGLYTGSIRYDFLSLE